MQEGRFPGCTPHSLQLGKCPYFTVSIATFSERFFHVYQGRWRGHSELLRKRGLHASSKIVREEGPGLKEGRMGGQSQTGKKLPRMRANPKGSRRFSLPPPDILGHHAHDVLVPLLGGLCQVSQARGVLFLTIGPDGYPK